MTKLKIEHNPFARGFRKENASDREKAKDTCTSGSEPSRKRRKDWFPNPEVRRCEFASSAAVSVSHPKSLKLEHVLSESTQKRTVSSQLMTQQRSHNLSSTDLMKTFSACSSLSPEGFLTPTHERLASAQNVHDDSATYSISESTALNEHSLLRNTMRFERPPLYFRSVSSVKPSELNILREDRWRTESSSRLRPFKSEALADVKGFFSFHHLGNNWDDSSNNKDLFQSPMHSVINSVNSFPQNKHQNRGVDNELFYQGYDRQEVFFPCKATTTVQTVPNDRFPPVDALEAKYQTFCNLPHEGCTEQWQKTDIRLNTQLLFYHCPVVETLELCYRLFCVLPV